MLEKGNREIIYSNHVIFFSGGNVRPRKVTLHNQEIQVFYVKGKYMRAEEPLVTVEISKQNMLMT